MSSQKVVYLPSADRYCADCGQFRAVARACVRRNVSLLALSTDCGQCGDRVERPTDHDLGVPTDAVCGQCGIADGDDETNPLIRVSGTKAGRWEHMCMQCLEAADAGSAR